MLPNLAVQITGGHHVGRARKRRSRRPGPRAARETAADQIDPIWVDVCGRRMFVVGWISGGAPYGVFEDEMDAAMRDLDASEGDQPY